MHGKPIIDHGGVVRAEWVICASRSLSDAQRPPVMKTKETDVPGGFTYDAASERACLSQRAGARQEVARDAVAQTPVRDLGGTLDSLPPSFRQE